MLTCWCLGNTSTSMLLIKILRTVFLFSSIFSSNCCRGRGCDTRDGQTDGNLGNIYCRVPPFRGLLGSVVYELMNSQGDIRFSLSYNLEENPSLIRQVELRKIQHLCLSEDFSSFSSLTLLHTCAKFFCILIQNWSWLKSLLRSGILLTYLILSEGFSSRL